ncbi:MAG TPA: gamma carbonic anhydrase family protein, partial [Acidimicrobiales bacterium]|nr:gamma carbonic anhydrase family protein [Acidimicrobiales bacterium]
AAGAVVTNDTVVPAGALALGVPASIRPDASHVWLIEASAAEYVANAARYRRELRRVDRPD